MSHITFSYYKTRSNRRFEFLLFTFIYHLQMFRTCAARRNSQCLHLLLHYIKHILRNNISYFLVICVKKKNRLSRYVEENIFFNASVGRSLRYISFFSGLEYRCCSWISCPCTLQDWHFSNRICIHSTRRVSSTKRLVGILDTRLAESGVCVRRQVVVQ